MGIKRNKASFYKAGFDIINRYNNLKRFVKTGQEILFSNMDNVMPHKIFDIKRIYAFKDKKINKVKRLKPVRKISRYIKRNNIIILIIFFEFNRIVIFVTVKNKKTFNAFRMRFDMLIEIFNLF